MHLSTSQPIGINIGKVHHSNLGLWLACKSLSDLSHNSAHFIATDNFTEAKNVEKVVLQVLSDTFLKSHSNQLIVVEKITEGVQMLD